MLISSQMARAIPDNSPLHPFILYSPNSAFKLACEIVRPSFADFDTNLSLPRGRKRSLPKEMEGLSVGCYAGRVVGCSQGSSADAIRYPRGMEQSG